MSSYSINERHSQSHAQYPPEMRDPTYVGEHGDYDPYAGLDQAQIMELEGKRKQEINQILEMIGEMKMSDDSDASDDSDEPKPRNKKKEVKQTKQKKQQSESEYSDSEEDDSDDSDSENSRRKKKKKKSWWPF